MKLTFSLIKPVFMGKCIEILSAIKKGGFDILAMKTQHLSVSEIGVFYKEHAERPFFQNICQSLSSGPVLLMALRRTDGGEAPLSFRTLLGATNPKEAAPGTLRALFGTDLDNNAIHGSDSKRSAVRELCLFFNGLEIGVDVVECLAE